MLKENRVKAILYMLLIVVLVGCSSASKNSVSVENASLERMSGSTSSSMSTNDSSSVVEIGEIDTVGVAIEDVTEESEISMSLYNDVNRKIIKTGKLYLQTKTFDETVNALIEEVNAKGGFVQESSIYGNDIHATRSERHASLTIRIPNEYFDSFINGADQYGNVLTRSMHGEDITDQYVDVETRKQVLEIRRERLIELLEGSGTLQELFEIEKELGNVNYEIERLAGTLSHYDSLVEYSTINIEVEEVVEYTVQVEQQTFGTRLKNSFKYAVKDFAKAVESSILWAARNFIGIIFWGVVLIVGIYILKKKGKIITKIDIGTKHKDKKEDDEDE